MRVPKQISSPKALVRCYSVSIEKKVRINIEIVRFERCYDKESMRGSDEIKIKNEPEMEKSFKFETDPAVGYSVSSSDENSNLVEPTPEGGLEMRSLYGRLKYSEKVIPETEINLKPKSGFLGKTSEKDLKPESGFKGSSISRVSSVLKKTVSDLQKSPKQNLNKNSTFPLSNLNSPEPSGFGTDLNIVEVLSEEEIENSNNKSWSINKENKSEELYSFGSSSQSSEHLQNSYFLC